MDEDLLHFCSSRVCLSNVFPSVVSFEALQAEFEAFDAAATRNFSQNDD